MKKKFKKMSVAVAATVLFFGVMLLSVEKNESGNWEFIPVSTYAQGESGNVCQIYCQSFPGLGCRVSYDDGGAYTCWHMEPRS